MATNTTPNLALRYPDGNETPALDVLLGNLASDTDAAIFARDARRLAALDTTTAVADSDGTADTVGTGTFTVPDYGDATRLVRVDLDARLNTTVANNLVSCKVQVDGADVTLVQAVLPTTGGAGQAHLGNTRSVTLAPGSHTYTVATQRVSGSGSGGIAEAHLTIADAGIA